jgi:hypothetical protein
METLRYCSLNVNVLSSLQEFADTPHMIGDPSRHAKRDPKRTMHAASHLAEKSASRRSASLVSFSQARMRPARYLSQ